MTLRKPSIFFRLIILGAQGVFYNIFCKSKQAIDILLFDNSRSVLTYLIAPRACHRFVGHLEEEAVLT